MKRTLFLLGIIFLLGYVSYSQDQVIVVLGSSTALGNKASPVSDSSYVSRLKAAYKRNTNDDMDTTIQLLAHTGYNTYNAMPTGYELPPNRTDIDIDEERNITRALSFHPDIVIINFPSNDSRIGPDYLITETMNNFRLMFQMVTETGARCYITTAQPRDDFNMTLRTQLKELTDSVLSVFGLYALNFWDDLVRNDGSYLRKPELVPPNDGIHVNNEGHRLLFERIMAKQIFNPVADAPLPVILSGFSAFFNRDVVEVVWAVEMEEPETLYEIQRSPDGTHFTPVFRKAGEAGLNQRNEYSWTDPAPLLNRSFYRLKIREPQGIRYSRIVHVFSTNKNAFIDKVYVNQGDVLIETNNIKRQGVTLQIFNQQGLVVLQAKRELLREKSEIRIPFDIFKAGIYIVAITTPEGNVYVSRFVKAK